MSNRAFWTAGLLEGQLGHSKELLEETKHQHKMTAAQLKKNERQKCHRSFKTSMYEEHKDYNPPRAPGTCNWALNDPKYHRWNKSSTADLLWISADPGCGKSVLARSLVDSELRKDGDTVCYFFFKDNEVQDRLPTALCAVLHQLFVQEPDLIEYAMPFWEEHRTYTDVNELWRLLTTVVNSSPFLSLICVLDALDECRDVDRSKLIFFLTQFYR